MMRYLGHFEMLEVKGMIQTYESKLGCGGIPYEKLEFRLVRPAMVEPLPDKLRDSIFMIISGVYI